MMNLGPSVGRAGAKSPVPRRRPIVLSLRCVRGARQAHHSDATYLIRNRTTTKRPSLSRKEEVGNASLRDFRYEPFAVSFLFVSAEIRGLLGEARRERDI